MKASANELRLISLANDYSALAQRLRESEGYPMKGKLTLKNVARAREITEWMAKGLGEICEILAEEIGRDRRRDQRIAQVLHSLSDSYSFFLQEEEVEQ